jgi:hypothetical protein
MRAECEAVFLFVAELTGSFVPGTGTEEDKIVCGQQDYIHSKVPTLDLTNEEDRKDLHEVVWLERLYAELDRYFELPNANVLMRTLAIQGQDYHEETYKWEVPLELDASASMLQYEGILTNDRRLMEMTNVIGSTLQDPWKLDGMPRKMLKKAATPMLYGSNQSCHALWQDAGISYTPDDIAIYSKEMADGPFGVANLLKEFIINNCNPQTTMKVQIANEQFDVTCNRFRNVGKKAKAYKIWDTLDQKYNIVIHTDTEKVPDLVQFRRYFITLLIHNLDSQVADSVIGQVMAKYGWGISIHDAFIVSPAAAADTRKWYAEELEGIQKNRKQILENYFKSIGITAASADQWNTLQAKVVPFEGEFKANAMALK